MVAPPMPFLPPAAHGQLVVMTLLCYAGDAEAGERALAPFRALADPIADMVQPMPYAGLFEPADDMEVVEESARSLFMDGVDSRAATAIVEQLRATTAPMAVAQLRVLGGAMARVPAEATAFATATGGSWPGSAASTRTRASGPPTRPGPTGSRPPCGAARACTSTSSANEGPDRVREAYPGRTWDRLVEVKRRYDPGNLFRLNQNIPPT
jgi:hypothetical protein